MAECRFVFVSLAPCGHAQSVYADVLQSDGSQWVDEIFGDLRAELTVKRVTLANYQDNYAKNFLCGCDAYRKAINERAQLENPSTDKGDQP